MMIGVVELFWLSTILLTGDQHYMLAL